jgi:triosephosphate isomerase
MPRRRLIVGNWKMHWTPSETAEFLRGLLPLLSVPAGDVEVAVAPPFLSLPKAAERLEKTRIALAAQDAHWEEEGPFTGEVSAKSLEEVGCKYVIVGHSERREHFGDTDRRVNRKAKAVLFWRMTPIICIGERADARAAGRAMEVVDRQLKLALAGLRLREEQEIVVAYEPVWAIGTGRNATPAEASEIHARIRSELTLSFGEERAGRTRILYGGSVSAVNAERILAAPEIDGALVGGASLNRDTFQAICRAAAAPEAPSGDLAS